ncbi:unnamed protein product, partial [Closterium sp. Naga37s-1]
DCRSAISSCWLLAIRVPPHPPVQGYCAALGPGSMALVFGVEATGRTLMLVERTEEMVRSLLPFTPIDNMRVCLFHPT